jgi:hypothetical protein
LATPDPLEAEDRPGRKSRPHTELCFCKNNKRRIIIRYRPGGGQPYLRALNDRFQASPPPTTLGAPWGRGCPIPPQKHGRSGRTSSTLDSWLGQFGTRQTRRRGCQAPALRRARHPERGGGTEAPQTFRRGESGILGTHGPVGFDHRSFFPGNGRSPVSHPTCNVPFPPRRTGEYWKGMI